MTKYIFITGGVVSSLGKGIIGASLGKLLRARGYSVAIQKFDPYINVDPGTMSPFQHGEVFVTDDGAETDLDLGHYERFTDTSLGKLNNVTSGSVYQHVIKKERRGDYLGGTVQVIPHITNEIKSRINGATKQFKPDFQLIEIGGTVGDIESLPFVEAIRQFKAEAGQKLFVHHIEGAENGSTVEFEKVLLVDKDGNVTVGAPIVEGAKVICQVVSNLVKGDKVLVFHKKRRKGHRKLNGHRQQFTELTITEVVA